MLEETPSKKQQSNSLPNRSRNNNRKTRILQNLNSRQFPNNPKSLLKSMNLKNLIQEKLQLSEHLKSQRKIDLFINRVIEFKCRIGSDWKRGTKFYPSYLIMKICSKLDKKFKRVIDFYPIIIHQTFHILNIVMKI